MLKEHHQHVIKDINYWYENELFTWNWWVLIAFIIFPWIIWARVVDRRKLLEIILVGTLAIIPTSYLDAIGLDVKFWIYPTKFLPITPKAAPFDTCMVPVAYMLLYQFFRSWKILYFWFINYGVTICFHW
ncbi:CBO0543 family protein [Bacillus salipaludis]|uniref:CBO0543 family protein n=1 Tax=Bacillus salipaludis TaxID=2547811 RepID=UPI002E1AE165|nr:hypothetical protein [Bacillus salipaludis]